MYIRGLTNYGRVALHGETAIDLNQHWLVASRYQVITRYNVYLSSVRPNKIHLRAVSQEIPQPFRPKISFKIIYNKFHSNLPGSDEFMVNYGITSALASEIPQPCTEPSISKWVTSQNQHNFNSLQWHHISTVPSQTTANLTVCSTDC